MIDLPTITTFFGWCSVINIGLLLFYVVWLIVFRSLTKKLHSTLFNVDPEALDTIYFKFLANYKLGIIIFSIVPYIALKIMA